MIKGDVFNKQYFPSNTFALFIDTFLNSKNGIINGYKNSFALSNTTNSITISSGALCVRGRFIREDSSTTINVSYNTNTYCKLVIEIDLDKVNTISELNQVVYKVLSSESGYPTLTQTDIVKNESGIYQYELARFMCNSSGISQFTDKRTFIDFNGMYQEVENAIHDIEQGSIFRLKGERLWTNNNPTTSFGPQTVSFTTNDYDYYRIGFRLKTDSGSNRKIYMDIKPGDAFDVVYHTWYTPGSQGYIQSLCRTYCGSSNNSITFTKCFKYFSNNPTAKTQDDNTCMIPLTIDGYYL